MFKRITISKKVWIYVWILILGYSGSMIFGFVNGKKTNSRLINASEYIFPASRHSQTALTSFKEQINLSIGDLFKLPEELKEMIGKFRI